MNRGKELLELEFFERAAVLGNAKMTRVFLDRLTHHCDIEKTGDGFFRFRHSTLAANTCTKALEAP